MGLESDVADIVRIVITDFFPLVGFAVAGFGALVGLGAIWEKFHK